PIAGAAVEVPAGALAAPTTITIEPGADIGRAGSAPVGPAAVFGPSGTTFAVPVEVTLPFEAATLPAGRTAADIVVLRRQSIGAGAALSERTALTAPDGIAVVTLVSTRAGMVTITATVDPGTATELRLASRPTVRFRNGPAALLDYIGQPTNVSASAAIAPP